MEKQYNFYNLEASFKNFLLAGNKTSVTIKNYLSDLRHFLGWNVLKFRIHNSEFRIEDISTYLTTESVKLYQDYLNENNVPEKTIKRRLSTMAKFCSFCISQGWIKENPIKQLRITDCELKLPIIDRTLIEYKKVASLEDYNNISDFISFIKSD